MFCKIFSSEEPVEQENVVDSVKDLFRLFLSSSSHL